MKKEWWILLGIGVLGLVYLMRRAKPQPQENIVVYKLEAGIPNFEYITNTTPKKTDKVKTKPKKTGKVIKKTDSIIVRNALKNYQLSNAVIKAYTDPEIAKILPTQPTELKRVLHPLFEEKRLGERVPRDIRIPY